MKRISDKDKQAILELLPQMYPDAHVELDHTSPFELLIATVLSAQCTDKQVNKVTPALFAAYPTPQALAAATVHDVEQLIHSCGFFRTKAKNIIAAAKMICEEYEGEVPADLEQLQRLPGVGRKTADVVLAGAFGMDAIAVDTHVFRVANRLGLADAKDVLKTEHQLMEAIPKEQWKDAHLWLIFHGRRCCSARKPQCEACRLQPHCRMHQTLATEQ